MFIDKRWKRPKKLLPFSSAAENLRPVLFVTKNGAGKNRSRKTILSEDDGDAQHSSLSHFKI